MIGAWTKSEVSTWFRVFHRGMNGIYTLADWKQFIADVTRVKRDWERLELMLDGYLLPAKDAAGHHYFLATEEGLASSRRADVERAGSWLEVELERIAAEPAPAKTKPWKPSGFPLFETLEHEASGVAVH